LPPFESIDNIIKHQNSRSWKTAERQISIPLKQIKIMEKFKELEALVETAKKEGTAFYEKGNNAAGTRFRNALQQIKVLATDLRKDVTDKKNAGK
jgi:hypothetical protein